MRPIKFRAWDKVQGKMRIDILSVDINSEYDNKSIYFREGNYLHQKDAELMQFTGLHDKNGKEIYEGDILKDKGNEIVEVKWAEERNGWSFNKPFLGWEEGHVIGNIYENPELLNQ